MTGMLAALVCFVFACVLAWTGLGLGIAAVSYPIWIQYGNVRQGLFRFCLSDNNCGVALVGFLEAASLTAVRVFMIAMLPVACLACILNHVSACNYSKAKRLAATTMFAVAGLFGIIGVSVFTAGTQASITSGAFYSSGFILAWVAPGAEFGAALFAFVSVRLMDNSYVQPDEHSVL